MHPYKPLLAIALVTTMGVAGCLGDAGDDLAPSSSPAADAEATTIGRLASEHTLVSIQAGAGVPGTWALIGDNDATVHASENATQLTVHANLTDPGANATGPGAGIVAFTLHDGDEPVATKEATPPDAGVVFEVSDPGLGAWQLEMEPLGADVDRTAVVTMLVRGPVPTATAGG